MRRENAGIELTDVHSCCIITGVMVTYNSPREFDVVDD